MGSALAQADLVGELADLVVTAVGLDMAPESIDPDLQLFGEGLGLDSIDMLEIALAITQKYGFQLRSDNPDNEQIFRSLRTLGAHVALNRVR
jgi:acyl carrier protein